MEVRHAWMDGGELEQLSRRRETLPARWHWHGTWHCQGPGAKDKEKIKMIDDDAKNVAAAAGPY